MIKTIVNKSALIYFFFIIIMAVLVVFYQFLVIPKNLSFDEVDFARLALSLAKQSYIPYSTLATGHSTLYFYILLFFLKVFGVSNLALRLPAAIFGVLSTMVFYFLMKKIFARQFIAFLTTIFFLTERWFFNFARFSFEATFLIFLELTSLYFFYSFLKKSKSQYLVLSAVFAGLAFHSYYPGRIFFLVPLLVFLSIKKFRPALIFCAVFFVIILPLIIYIPPHHDNRLQQLLIINDNRLTTGQKLLAVADNAVRTTAMFMTKGDLNGRHNYPGKPALNPIQLIFFLGGLAVSFIHRKTMENKIFLLLLAISLISTLLTPTIENPHMLRTVTATIAVAYFAGILMEKLQKRYVSRVVIAGLILIITVSAFYDLRTYFLFQSRVVRNSFEVTCPLPQVIKYDVNSIPIECRVTKILF